MDTIDQCLLTVQTRIRDIAQAAGRDPASIQLLAVSKTRNITEIQQVLNAGITHFGENYLQEALEKIEALSTKAIDWHFIGPVQSNKTRHIAESFQWVHSVEREKIARRLNDQRRDDQPPLNVCLQVNISGELTKSGVDLAQLPELAATVAELPRLQLRGLMALPAPFDDLDQQRIGFRALREAMDKLNQQAYALDTLSMGTTHDLQAAILEGATIVRIGTAIFGPRQ